VIRFAGITSFVWFLFGCTPDWEAQFPQHFGSFENTDPYPLSRAAFELGRDLFYDGILSSDSTISCASCHHQSVAFADPRPVSVGIHGTLGSRNAQALINLNWSNSFFRDGTIHSLSRVPLAPLESEFEMDLNPTEMVRRLKAHPNYPAKFKSAYQEEPTQKGTIYALLAFQRMLISANSPYDRLLTGDEQALSAAAHRGMNLFFGKAGCGSCHTGVHLSDQNFHNIGLYEHYPDKGRMRFTFNPDDAGKFKTPGLRNVAFTAPYMHDGRWATLDAVLEHYNEGGKEHPQKSPLIKSLGLDHQEISDLKSFLMALSDTDFVTNPDFRNPLIK
jgi:cytochrome c peroxidase